MGKAKMFLLFFAVKLLSVFIVRTAFVPDEYWQSLEVAHRLAFGYGYLTWEWNEGLRSYIYPAIIAGVYKTLEFFGMDSREALILIPRILQSLLSSLGDYFFWLWVRDQTYTRGNWAAVTIATSWFWFYCGSRTLINTVETALTIFALYCYPWADKDIIAEKSRFLLPVGLACIMRPTAMIIWLPFCIYHLARVNSKMSVILKSYLPIGVVSILSSVLIDSYFYGKLIFTPWNFFWSNVFDGIGALYGIHSLYWYIFCGIPAVLGIYLIPFLYGAWKILKTKESAIESILLFAIAWTTFVYRVLLWCVGIALVIGNAVPAVYFGLYHQRGTLDVMDYVTHEASKNQTNMKILFLMPCHTTPLYSHLHMNVPTKFLSCEPDFSAKPGYMDEADLFYLGPLTWVNKAYPPNSVFPSHIVMFDVLQPHLQGFLNANGYSLVAKFFHAHFIEGRVGENVVVHSRIG